MPAGALYVRAGMIADAGPYTDLRARYPDAPVIGDGSHVVAPGFVNAHSHGRGVSTLRQGFPDEPLELRSIGLRGSLLADPYWDVRYACGRQALHGITTTVHADSYYAGPVEGYEMRLRRVLAAYRDSGLRFRVALGIKDQNTFTYVDDDAFLAGLPRPAQEEAGAWPRPSLSVDDYLALYGRLAAEYGTEVLQFGPTNPVWCSDDLLAALDDQATRRGVRLHIHLLETIYQRAYAVRQYGQTAVARLEALGLLHPGVTFVHCVWATAEDLALLADAGADIAHNPSSNLRLRSGVAPVPAMVRRGISIGLGIDSLAMNDDDDILEEARLAHLLHSRPGLSCDAIPPGLVLAWATTGGARIAGDANVGTLHPGSHADAILFSGEEPPGDPADAGANIAAALVQRPRAFQIDTVMVGGRPVVTNGRLAGCDAEALERRALESWSSRPAPPVVDTVRAEVVRILAGWHAEEAIRALID